MSKNVIDDVNLRCSGYEIQEYSDTNMNTELSDIVLDGVPLDDIFEIIKSLLFAGEIDPQDVLELLEESDIAEYMGMD